MYICEHEPTTYCMYCKQTEVEQSSFLATYYTGIGIKKKTTKGTLINYACIKCKI